MHRSQLSREACKVLNLLEDGLVQAQKVTIKKRDPYSGKVYKVKPFFISFYATRPTSTELRVRDGAVFGKTVSKSPNAYVIRGDMRVGDCERGCNTDTGFYLSFPYDLDLLAFKRDVWREITELIHNAENDLEKSRVESSKIIDEAYKAYSFFSKESPVIWYKFKKPPKLNLGGWEDIMKKASLIFRRNEIIDSSIRLNYEFEERYFVSSEGTRIVDTDTRIELLITAFILDKDGIIYEVNHPIHELNIKHLPKEDNLYDICESVVEELYEIKNAPFQEAGLYPSILRGSLPGAYIHEPFHALEAHRQIDEESDEGEDLGWTKSLTFKNKIGKEIAPSFLTIVDDPTEKGRYGSYKFDGEGVEGKKIVLVKNGKLMNLIHSRNSAGRMSKLLKKTVTSNGHCRLEGMDDDGEPRMSNLIGTSSKYWSRNELTEMLVERCKKLNLPYGLVGEDFISGANYLPNNVFHVMPKRLYRLYAKDGRIERVKGSYITSTPLRALREIKAVSSSYGFVNCICGASSGQIPVSFEMPEMFFNSLEFAEVDRTSYKRLTEKLSKPPSK